MSVPKLISAEYPGPGHTYCLKRVLQIIEFDVLHLIFLTVTVLSTTLLFFFNHSLVLILFCTSIICASFLIALSSPGLKEGTFVTECQCYLQLVSAMLCSPVMSSRKPFGSRPWSPPSQAVPPLTPLASQDICLHGFITPMCIQVCVCYLQYSSWFGFCDGDRMVLVELGSWHLLFVISCCVLRA